AAKLAVGYTLDELPNDITRETPASFEPTIDYVVTKIPRWDFGKFPGAKDILGTQMKSVGEAMSIGRTFKESLQKGISSLEIGRFGFGADGKDKIRPSEVEDPQERELLRQEIVQKISRPNSERLFYLRYAFELGMSVKEIFDYTGIDPWFLENLREILDCEQNLVAAFKS
ncbi:MAG: carbamoyl phosphate synthase large subunit, partial [Candidatus Omnitrophica bacterium]|nr:carbamoyl phosphate synthase large subunit [Candidatus Omnitrophota bacterium]